MSVIIRLQNLAWSANAQDIREFFKGMQIPEGGVHIVGGEMGDAFIAFGSDEDARLAMMKTGESLKGVQITLQLSSRTQMQNVIETARQQAMGAQNHVAPAQPAPTPASTPAQAPSSTPSSTPQTDKNSTQPDATSKASQPPMFPNAYGQHYPAHMAQYGYPFPYTPEQHAFMQSQFAAMGMTPQAMNQFTSQYYAQMYQNQMARGGTAATSKASAVEKDASHSQSPLPQNAPPNTNSGSVSANQETDENTNKPIQHSHKNRPAPSQPEMNNQSQQKSDRRDDKRTSPIRSRSRDRERRRRHRSRSRSWSRDRSNRRRKSRSRERERTRDRDRDRERDRKEKDSRGHNYRERNEQRPVVQEMPETKPGRPDTSGGIPGLGDIPENIPREGLSIYSSNVEEGPQISTNDAGWPSKEKENMPSFDKGFPPKNLLPTPTATAASLLPHVQDKGPGLLPVMPINMHLPTDMPMPMVEMKKDPRLPPPTASEPPPPFNQLMPHQQSDPFFREGKKPRVDSYQENSGREMNEWNKDRYDDNRQDGRDAEWFGKREPERRSDQRFDEQNFNQFASGPFEPSKRDFDPRHNQDNQFGPPGRGNQNSEEGGRPWFPDRRGRGERGGGFDFKRGRGRFQDSPANERQQDIAPGFDRPSGFGRGGRRGEGHDSGRGWSRGGGSFRGRQSRFSDAEERDGDRKAPRCVKIFPIKDSASFRHIKNPFHGIYIPYGAVKILVDEKGLRTNVALIQFHKAADALEAVKRQNNIVICGENVEIRLIDDETFQNSPSTEDVRYNRGPPPEKRLDNLSSPCMYLSGLPPGATEKDVAGFFRELSINFSEVAIEYDQVSHNETGGCFLRVNSPDETNFAMRRVPSLSFKGSSLNIEICPEEAMGNYMRSRGIKDMGNDGRQGPDRRGSPFNQPFKSNWSLQKQMRDLPPLMPPHSESLQVNRNMSEPRFQNDEPQRSRFPPHNEPPMSRSFQDGDNMKGNFPNDRPGQSRLRAPAAGRDFQDKGGRAFDHRNSPAGNGKRNGERGNRSSPPPPQQPHPIIYISALPFGSTEQDVERLLIEKSVSTTQVVLELEKGSRQPTGGFFLRFDSVDSSKKAFRALLNSNLEGRTIKVEYSPQEFIERAIVNRQKLNIFTKKPINSSGSESETVVKPTAAPGAIKKNPTPKIDSNSTNSIQPKVENKVDKPVESGKATSPFGTNLLTDSIIVKNVSEDVTPSDVSNFFSDDGLVPETVHFNPRDSNAECDVYVVFTQIEAAKRALSKSGKRLGSNDIQVQLISKPAVMSAMGKQFNPQDLFKKKGTSTTSPHSISKSPLESSRNETAFDGSKRDSRDGPPPPPSARSRLGLSSPPHKEERPNKSGPSSESSRVPQSSVALGKLVTPDTFGRPGCVVALGNVPLTATTDDILYFLLDFPMLTPECVIRRYDEMNRPTPDARVAFESPKDAQGAISKLNGRMMKNCKIKLSLVN